MPLQTLTGPEIDELRDKVRDMYVKVAREPRADFHFETGRALAERLGYPPAELDRIPQESIDSFAGVGYHLDLPGLRPGEVVLDLGSGSGMDAFLAALRVGTSGRVIGIDMTAAQLEKAERLRSDGDWPNLEFREGLLEDLPLEAESVDVVISNGVINLCPDKARTFREIARVLRPGGRMAVADIVTERQLPENVTCNTSLWAACIGGAAQESAYRSEIEGAGLRVAEVVANPGYQFLSRSARNASREYGVKSVCLLAVKSS